MLFEKLFGLLSGEVGNNTLIEDFLVEVQVKFDEGNISRGMLLAYTGLAEWFRARQPNAPVIKLNFYHKASGLLNSAVRTEPNNPEIRLLRFYSEWHCEADYFFEKNYTADKNVIMLNLDVFNDRSTPSWYLASLLSPLIGGPVLSTDEKNMLIRWLNAMLSQENKVELA